MSQGRWIDGRLVNEVFVVNQTSGGGGGGGVTEEQVTGIVSGYIASGISSDIIPTQSGAYDIGSASMPFKDGYFTSGSLYLADSHLFIDADQNLCIENTVISGEPLTTSGQVSGMLAAPKSSYSFIDAGTSATVTLSTRDGGLIVTDPFTESVSNVDLGATTPDPGHLLNVFIDGTGRYSVGASTLNNANGLITLEYINSPGQFFVINDVDGGVFGPGDRQSFGLVRETLVDGTDLDGATGPLAGGNSGGWSVTYTWYYTGGFPYAWTSYAIAAQTPGGSSLTATGTFSAQNLQRQWWDLCGRAGVGKKMRWGIANGTLSDQSGQNFTNRLICQMYVSTEMLAHPDAASLLPATVISNGAGWYTQAATIGEYENMGSFPNGNDKGYRFRWSTFGNTTLSQLPYVQGVSSNDQIAAAAGNSHYVVYDANAVDVAAANTVVASGNLGPNNRFYSSGTTCHILQFNNPYDFPNTPSGDVYDLKYTYVGPLQASPIFNTYDVSTVDALTNTAIAVAPLEKLHNSVCDEVRQAVTAYYLVRDLDFDNTAIVNTMLFDAIQSSLGGQLINTYDAVTNTAPDDITPSGTGGEVLFPQILKTAIQEKLALWIKTLPDN